MAAATCPPAYDWAKNSQGMDPCAVASKLINVCDIDIAPLMQIARDTSYPPPTTDTQTICTCSGPVYALVSACADCQYGLFDPWNVWSQHCSHIFETFFLHPPVTIPTWASQFNIYTNWTYDLIYAQALALPPQPQSTSTSVAFSTTLAAPLSSKTDTTASSSTTSPSAPLTNIPTGNDISTSTTASQYPTAILGTNQPDDQARSGSLNKGNNKGAIAGGVVGGLIFLVAVGSFLFWWLQRRRRSRTAPSAAYIAAYGTARPPTSNSFRPGQFDERAGSPLVSQAYSNSRAEKYRDDEKLTNVH